MKAYRINAQLLGPIAAATTIVMGCRPTLDALIVDGRYEDVACRVVDDEEGARAQAALVSEIRPRLRTGAYSFSSTGEAPAVARALDDYAFVAIETTSTPPSHGVLVGLRVSLTKGREVASDGTTLDTMFTLVGAPIPPPAEQHTEQKTTTTIDPEGAKLAMITLGLSALAGHEVTHSETHDVTITEPRVVPVEDAKTTARITELLVQRVPSADWYAVPKSELEAARVDVTLDLRSTWSEDFCSLELRGQRPLGLAPDQHGPDFVKLESWSEETARVGDIERKKKR